MRRWAPATCAIAAVITLAAGCGSERPAPAPQTTDALVKATDDLTKLMIMPDGFNVRENAVGREASGPFDADRYLSTHSASPYLDKPLFDKTRLVDGYYRYLTEEPRLRRMQIYLFRLRSAADAQILQKELWSRKERGQSFAVPGMPAALTEMTVKKSYRPDKTVAEATVSFVSGPLLATITVRQAAPLITNLAPDTKLAIESAKQQLQKLTSQPTQANQAPAAPAG